MELEGRASAWRKGRRVGWDGLSIPKKWNLAAVALLVLVAAGQVHSQGSEWDTARARNVTSKPVTVRKLLQTGDEVEIQTAELLGCEVRCVGAYVCSFASRSTVPAGLRLTWAHSREKPYFARMR
eukprot:2380951-Pyramimonas_sp.AAC.1